MAQFDEEQSFFFNQHCRSINFILLLVLVFSKHSFSQTTDPAISNKIDMLVQNLYSRGGQFSGSILVSTNEKIVYEKVYGKSIDIVIVRKNNKIIRLKINKLTTTTSAEELLATAEKITNVL